MSAFTSPNDAFGNEVRGVFDRVVTSRTEVPISHGRYGHSSDMQEYVELVVDDAELVHQLR